MAPMRWIPILGTALCASCLEPPPQHQSRPAFPIKSACTASSRRAVDAGIDVRAGRRHSQAQTVAVTNLSGDARAVAVQQVSRVEGPCSADWARQTPLNFVDSATRTRPAAVTLEPGASVRVEIGDQRVNATWACTKLGLAIWIQVEGELVCADAGAWISEPDLEDS